MAAPTTLRNQKRSYLANATASVEVLQSEWYSSSSGLWQELWWNSGSILSTVVSAAVLDDSIKDTIEAVIANTFKEAPDQGDSDGTGFISPHASAATTGSGFLNGFYDDEGWWAMGWINAYDLTGNSEYLEAAQDIFDDMLTGWTTSCGGGIWWDKAHTYVAAIANELFLSVAAHLANRVPAKKSTYLGWALQEWEWFSSIGLINANDNINDGLGSNCENNNGPVWSYNQGVVLGGLVELSRATGEAAYLRNASSIALAAIRKLSNADGILVDPTTANPDTTASQFKGIFVRYLAQLQGAAPDSRFVTFLQENADSIWQHSRDASNGELGPNWQGPYVTASAASHSAALDCLIAAAAVS